MNYQIELIVKQTKDKVKHFYLDKIAMFEWMDGLFDIKQVEKKPFEEGSISFLVFKFENQVTEMKMTVEKREDDLQSVIYEVPGAWNKCVSRFRSDGSHTKWVMDVTFLFEQEVNIPLERFIEKTKAGMMIYKNYVENL